MKQLLISAAAIALCTAATGCSSSMSHHDGANPSSSSSSYNRGMAGGNGTMGEDPVHPGAYTEGGSAAVDDHRNDAGNRAAHPASDRQSSVDDGTTQNNSKSLGDSD